VEAGHQVIGLGFSRPGVHGLSQLKINTTNAKFSLLKQDINHIKI
jgi:hypothetical protein